MISSMAPNVRGVDAPGRRTVYSMCGMCSVRCPIGKREAVMETLSAQVLSPMTRWVIGKDEIPPAPLYQFSDI
jgi:hypothetical protein